ncbi:uncharacterized protein AMSG_08153 [Thecamonas trahens ATCC 50062]|uniref:F-box/LRR-repeat protein 15-like leucin rich repeat domain-containing protein n=1 Tax=Thecamonas trahens ATCC 50062 TaxID=461836 RepID=A0A0L0DII5_THETB|nr:hypothetical protein AMSG_08153 [Thecamonas trahens ATCC 50062]KNC51916.1 hypothetical protein AMSG_08153 [Thecamonas trahens ATCC 50062]|eukprot:XP_013755513.1 hypothetical protein AMSG_08153 [Thecamonas trahens ATCC 50062]
MDAGGAHVDLGVWAGGRERVRGLGGFDDDGGGRGGGGLGFDPRTVLERGRAMQGAAVVSSVTFVAHAGVDDDVVDVVDGYGDELQSIDLKGSCVSDDSIIAIARACPLLAYIDLSQTSLVTDRALSALAAGCPRLMRVKLARAKGVSDAGLVALASSCSELVEVDVSGCDVGDAGVAALAAGAAGLAHLELNGCVKVSDAAVAAVVGLCPQMEVLGLEGCVGLDALVTLEVARAGQGSAPALTQESVAMVLACSKGAPHLVHHLGRVGALPATALGLARAAGMDILAPVRAADGLGKSSSQELVDALVVRGFDPFEVEADGRHSYTLAPGSVAPAVVQAMRVWLATHGDGAADVAGGINRATLALFVSLRAGSEVRFSAAHLGELIRAGANVNALEPVLGQRPLHIAASGGQMATVMALLAAGAELWAMNAAGEGAYALATSHELTALLTGATELPAPFVAHMRQVLGHDVSLRNGNGDRVEALEEALAAKASELTATQAELPTTHG